MATDKTGLGDRMKMYERREAGRSLMPGLPVCVRIDGKRFSRWTEGLARPYDQRLSDLMIETTIALVEETNACIGYTQSDEISLVLHDDDPKAKPYLGGRLQKLCSILSSVATAHFNARVPAALPERATTPALFDCRVWAVPNKQEAVNALLWRELDATKNSVSMAARTVATPAQMHGKRRPELHELLHAAGINWNDYPAFFKRGTFVQRRAVTRKFTTDELEALPPRHAARQNPDLEVTRQGVVRIEMPPFGQVVNRVEVVFEGAAPRTAGA